MATIYGGNENTKQQNHTDLDEKDGVNSRAVKAKAGKPRDQKARRAHYHNRKRIETTTPDEEPGKEREVTEKKGRWRNPNIQRAGLLQK